MIELKTLKDIQKESEEFMLIGHKEMAGIYMGGIKDIEVRLKQAAINWIKCTKEILIYKIPKKKDYLVAKYGTFSATSIEELEYEEIRLQETIKWIMYFFNLTEEDIENGI